jgi:F0F1-type ATP synthase assembly protein I
MPTLAGLIAVMPLTGLIVLVWLYIDNPGNFALMTDYTKGAVLGIVPTIMFFLVAFLCFHKQLPLWMVLCAGFAVWLVGAFIHQWLLK